ncbi:HEAT repeat domain-containing protein [Alkalinema sp. FACHB-956]|uniref:HEAT repeat domain-containing protein n=1 Tax=Alkalinema sp. FACHB-956 TaxID=2692768 RepID=UPI0016837506|nr:HEAT repeat domain-containing protein [Alkalinema sp. FACHB-956]MBD2327887.1 HEAT repeat domain-containing protein [Alkalinema sp. FACHB-956]
MLDDSDFQFAEPLTLDQALANLKGDDLGLRFYAAWWFGKFQVNHPEAIDLLILALEDTDDQTPEGGFPLRRNAARALGKLGDQRAVQPLIRSLDCSDGYVREAAANSLELLGDPAAIPPLLTLVQSGLENGQVSPLMANSQPFDALIEALGTLRATHAVPFILPFLEHPLERVQYAAARALYLLTGEDRFGFLLVEALEGDNLQLRRTALSDLGAIGFLPAAEPITQTLAENSLKLVALKGILEAQIDPTHLDYLSPQVGQVLELMDSLL